jgi:hypothetical protein
MFCCTILCILQKCGTIWKTLHSYYSFLQLHVEIAAACNESSELEVDDVLRMRFLLATVCESARLLPAGPLLQRCSLKHGMQVF